MTVDVITIFPRLIEAGLSDGILARARERGLVEVRVHDLRDFTDDAHRSVDDVPYGGGPGMVMKAAPIARAVDAIAERYGKPSAVILTTPQGRRFDQTAAQHVSALDRVIILCGRYEGIDERIAESVVTDEYSIGDYVLTGGELAALVMIDAAARLIPGVVGDADSVAVDSFADGLLDHPQYTRPAVFRGKNVPEVLVSGHHSEIARWRRSQRVRRTLARRPDLIDAAALTAEEREEINKGEGHEGH